MSKIESPGHSIRVASRLSSIPIETLRVWERRYGFPRPRRTVGTNRRLYSDEDIERLQWIARALEHGYRPGDVVDKSIAEIEQLLSADAERVRPAGSIASGIDRWIALLARNDVAAIEAELRSAAAALGPKRFVVELAQPLAVAVGDAWARGELDVHHEHLMSECLETELRHLLTPYQDVQGSPVVLLATLPGELHALGLSMVALYLSVCAAKPRLLGASTPVDQIVLAARALGADVVGLALTSPGDRDARRRDVHELLENLPRRVPLWLGGGAARYLGVRGTGLRLIETWTELEAAVAEQRRGTGVG